jgi:CDGSH-type Zn-finger protein
MSFAMVRFLTPLKSIAFCDGAHNTISLVASGEPATLSDTPLSVRDGRLEVERVSNGPLAVKGNVEICANTGRVVLRTNQTRLCRCGHSKNKPLCDNSHVEANFEDPL